MKNQEKISIIIPVYNIEKYLRRCLDSIQNQTWENIEVLLLDDGSTDSSGAICDQYAKDDARFIVHHLPHNGVVVARNFALEHFSGEYFMFADSDDLVCRQYVERLYEVLTEYDADVATCIAHDEDDPDIPVYEYEGREEPEWKMLEEYDFVQQWSHRVIWGAIYKKSVLGDIRFREEYKVSTDTLFFSEILKKVQKTIHINEELYCYIYYTQSIAHGTFNWNRYSDILVWERVAELFADGPEVPHISALTNVVTHSLEAAKKLTASTPYDEALYHQLLEHAKGKEAAVMASSLEFWDKRRMLSYIENPERYVQLHHTYPLHVWLLGGIDHGNLGDHQIVASMKEFLFDLMPEMVFHEIPLAQYFDRKKYLIDAILPDDVLLFCGGGNLGTLWPRSELLRRDAFRTWPENPKIVFPQSVFFADDEAGQAELEESRKIYSSDKNAILALRDEVSYTFAKKQFSCNMFLTPDMVLYSKYQKPEDVKREGCLFLMRQDKERALTDEAFSQIKRIVQERFSDLIIGDTVMETLVNQWDREQALEEMFAKIASSKMVITDRLHGMVFSAITGTPCIVLPNNHHKVEGVMKWVEDLPYIRFIHSIETLQTALDSLDLDAAYEYPQAKKRELFSDFRIAVQEMLDRQVVPRQDEIVKVSVVIPVYNVEPYLEKCLDSVINQTMQELEIICVNDGSTDGSREILERYAKQDLRIRIVDQENQGLSAARNTGMDYVTGKYLYFLDSDDYISPDAMERLYEKAEEMQIDLLCFNAEAFSDEDADENLAGRKEWLDWYYDRNADYPDLYSGNELMERYRENGDYLVAVWMHFYRTAFVKKTGLRFVYGAYHEDNSFTFECMTAAKRAAYLNQIFYHRYVRPGSITTIRQNFNHAYGYFACAEHMVDWIRDLGEKEEFSRLYHDIIGDVLKSSREIYFNLPMEERQKYQTLPAEQQSRFYELILLQKETDELIGGLRDDNDGLTRAVRERDALLVQYRRLLADNMARVDLKIFDSDEPSELEILSVSDRHAVLTEPAWFNKDGKGIVIETTSKSINLKIKCGCKGNLRIRPRGTDVRGEDGKREAHWIDYQSLKVNGQEKLGRAIAAWHDKPITIMTPVDVDDVINIHIEWGQHSSGKRAKAVRKVKHLFSK